MIRIKAAIKWTTKWVIAWIVWFIWAWVPFFILETIGLYAQWNNIPGYSTLSSWMVSHWGEVFMVCATIATASMLIWHWITVKQEQDKRKLEQLTAASIELVNEYRRIRLAYHHHIEQHTEAPKWEIEKHVYRLLCPEADEEYLEMGKYLF
jgi:hypothetical protein